jgi:hypothetical protein
MIHEWRFDPTTPDPTAYCLACGAVSHARFPHPLGCPGVVDGRCVRCRQRLVPPENFRICGACRRTLYALPGEITGMEPADFDYQEELRARAGQGEGE